MTNRTSQSQCGPHVRDQAGRDVRVGVDARPRLTGGRRAARARTREYPHNPDSDQTSALCTFLLSARAAFASARQRRRPARSRWCTSSLRGRRPFGDPTAYSQKSGNAIVESQYATTVSGSTPGFTLPQLTASAGRRAGQAAPDDLVGRDLDEVVVAALGNAVDLPQRRLRLQIEVLGRSAAEDHAAVLLAGAARSRTPR